MNRSIALRLAILAVGAIGAAAVNGLDAQNKAPGAYAVLDFSAVNSPDVSKILPSKTGDFDGHTRLIARSFGLELRNQSHSTA